MALVNSNLSAVMDALRNIRTAASGIETTRQLITQKYAQLGTGWNDRKYRELGLILTDCMKALMSILQILRQAEQPVSMLIESIRQYEEVNLGGGSGGGGGQYAGEGAAALVPPGTRAPGERERLLRGSLASIDQVIENYRQSLERRGLAQGFVMDMVLNRERFRLEADALRTLDGDFSQPTPDLTPEDLDGIILVIVPHEDHIVDPRADDREDNKARGQIPDRIRILPGPGSNFRRQCKPQDHADRDDDPIERNAKIADHDGLGDIRQINPKIRERYIHLTHHFCHLFVLSPHFFIFLVL